MSGVLVVFAKEPVPGRVKTRMTPPLAPAEAAALYACMLDDVLEASAAIARACGLEPVLAIDPPGAGASIARRAPAAFRVVAQRGPDLGARLAFAALEAAAAGASPIVIRGSDSPALAEPLVREALDALRHADVAIGPDRDGGYQLIGLNRPVAGLFERRMSTATVLDETCAFAEAAGLRVRRLAPGFDVDTAEDLRWLAAARRAGEVLPCPRTLALLDDTRLWSRLEPRGEHSEPVDARSAGRF